MSTTVCGRYAISNEDGSDVAAIYSIRENENGCDHYLRVYTRTMDRSGRPQIRETCIECGQFTTQQLKTSEHPDWAKYPTRNTEYDRLDEKFRRRFLRGKPISPIIYVAGDSSGHLIEQGELWHSRDLHYGDQCLDLWNQIIDGIPHQDIPRERRRALQFGLTSIFYHAKMIDIFVATSFEANQYASVITSAIAKRIPVESISISVDDSPHITRFGDGFRYNDFLASKQWAETKRLAIGWYPNSRSSRARRPVCEIPNCSRQDNKIDCHHLTYARAGHENEGDLIFVCSRCHQNIEYLKTVMPTDYQPLPLSTNHGI